MSTRNRATPWFREPGERFERECQEWRERPVTEDSILVWTDGESAIWASMNPLVCEHPGFRGRLVLDE